MLAPYQLFCSAVSSLILNWGEKKRPNHATIFLSFELLEKVVSTCTNMASVIWFDPDCITLGYSAALISWLYSGIPKGADDWQAVLGGHSGTWQIERLWEEAGARGKAAHGSPIRKGFKVLTHLYTVVHQLEKAWTSFPSRSKMDSLWSYSQFTPSPFSFPLTRQIRREVT